MEKLKTMIANIIKEIESVEFDPKAWLDDYYVDSLLYSVDGVLQGLDVIVAGNGPSITVNTKYRRVIGIWSSARVIAYYIDKNDLNRSVIEVYQHPDFI